MSKPLTHEQINKIIERFKQGGDNRTKIIAQELGINFSLTNKVIDNYLNSKNGNHR